MPFPNYNYEVDWNADGDFSDSLENISSEVRQAWFKRGRDADLGKSEVGRARIVVVDANRKYIPQNSSSAIVVTYGGIYPARPVRIQAGFTSTYTLFYGYLDDCLPEPGRNERQALLPCVDGFDQLKAANVKTGLQENAYSGGTSGMVQLVLNEAGWPAAKRTIDAGQLDSYPVIYAHEEAALDVLQKFEASEFGNVYIGRDGNVNWEDRHYRLTATRSTVSQAIITDSEFVKIRPSDSLKSVRNRIVMRAQPKTKAAAESDIWTLTENGSAGTSILIDSKATKVFWPEFADSDGTPNIAGSVADVLSGDYTAHTDQSGAGTVRTGYLSISSTIFAAGGKVEVFNSGDTGVYLTYLRMRGKIYTDQPALQIEAANTSSQLAYKRRDKKIELPYYQNANVMEGVAGHTLAQTKEPMPGFVVELINGNDAMLINILAMDISDRITLRSDDWGISGDYYIENVEHEIIHSQRTHKAWWTISRTDEQEYWILGQSKLGIGTRLAY